MTETNRSWILYDGDCALCRTWVARTYWLLRRRGFRFATLQSRRNQSLPVEQFLAEMRLEKPDGQTRGGADALIEIARAIWWAWPVWLASRLPGAMPILRITYRILAARRHCFDGACELGNKPAKHHSTTSAFFELP